MEWATEERPLDLDPSSPARPSQVNQVLPPLLESLVLRRFNKKDVYQVIYRL